MPSLNYLRRRLSSVIRYLNWWRIGLLAAVLGAAVLGTTVGPGVVWGIIAWVCGSALVVSIGARTASNHRAIAQGTTPSAPAATPKKTGKSKKRAAAVDPAEAARESAEDVAAVEEAARALLPVGAGPDAPLVTVVVPCFNDHRFLQACLDSVAAQTLTSWECIVVDDASGDTSSVIAVRMADRDDRFRVITHGRNGGLSAARNTGLLDARAPLITFLDSDDMLLADSLRSRLDEMLSRWSEPEVAGSYCAVVQVGESATVDLLPPATREDVGVMRDLLNTRGECPFNAHAPLVRTQLVREMGGFDETMLHGAEDWDLWLRMMRHGFCFYSAGQLGAVYRQRAASMVKRMPTGHLHEAKRLLASAHAPYDGPVRSDVAFMLDRPVGEHLADLDVAKRLYQFAGIVAVGSGVDGAREVLADLPPLPRVVVDRHLDSRGRVLNGVRRGLGLGPKGFRKVRTSYMTLADEIVEIADAIVGPRMPRPSRTEPDDIDVLVVAESAGQVGPLLDVVHGTDVSWRAVSIERATGARGVAEAFGAREVLASSMATHRLAGTRHAALLTARPYGASVAELVQQTKDTGGRVIEIDSGVADHLDDNANHADGGLSVDEARAALEPSAALATVWPAPYIASGKESIGAHEEYPRLEFDGEALADMRNMHAGETCVIVGNGPSLNQLDLGLLAHVPYFAVNGIFHASDRLPGPPPFYVVEDSAVAAENTDEINAYVAQKKFFPSRYRKMFGDDENTFYFRMNRGFYNTDSPHYCVPRFSTDASQRVYCGQSVTIINLQLAYHFGFSEVVLIGMDFSYTIPDDADRKGDLITSQSDDPNHFHPDYFGKGKTWKDPKLDRVLANYQMAKSAFEADGRRIVNSTVGGNLHIFDRKDFEAAVT